MKLVAFLLLACAALAQAQEGRFAFAIREEAWAVLGAQDDYVRSTTPLERTLVLRTPGKIDERAFAEAMASANSRSSTSPGVRSTRVRSSGVVART